jgi:hypothetical protein
VTSKRKHQRLPTAEIIRRADSNLSAALQLIDRHTKGRALAERHPTLCARCAHIRNLVSAAAGHIAHLRNRLADQDAEQGRTP